MKLIHHNPGLPARNQSFCVLAPTSASVAETRSSLQINSAPLAEIIPFPKSTQIRSSNRKHKKSEVISRSPYKHQLDKENEQKNKLKNKPKTKKTRKEYKKPKTNNKKKIWICLGCSGVYKVPIEEDCIECNTCGSWWMKTALITMGLGLLFVICANNVVAQSYRLQRAILHTGVYKIAQIPVCGFHLITKKIVSVL